MKIGYILTRLTAAEQAETYNLGIANISSKSHLSLASRCLRYSFHSLSSSARASLKDGTVLPTLFHTAQQLCGSHNQPQLLWCPFNLPVAGIAVTAFGANVRSPFTAIFAYLVELGSSSSLS